MKVRVQRVGHAKGEVKHVVAVPAHGDVVSLEGADRTVTVVDWNVGDDAPPEVAATVWVR